MKLQFYRVRKRNYFPVTNFIRNNLSRAALRTGSPDAAMVHRMRCAHKYVINISCYLAAVRYFAATVRFSNRLSLLCQFGNRLFCLATSLLETRTVMIINSVPVVSAAVKIILLALYYRYQYRKFMLTQ
jgi:hypothetical protein